MSTSVVARMCAYEAGQAVPLSSTRNFPILSDALILIPIAMAGEDPALFALGVANKQGNLQVLTCPNPTNRDHTYGMLKKCADIMHPVVEHWRLNSSSAPQIICQSDKAVSLMLAVFHRMLSAQDGYENTDALRRTGRVFEFFDRRYKREDSAASLSAPKAVMELYATGQDPMADTHLGALMEWFKPADRKINQRVQKAESLTSSTSTDPAEDRKIIAPLYDRFYRAEQSGNVAVAAQAEARIRAFFIPEIQRRFKLVLAALRVIEAIPETAYAVTKAASDHTEFIKHANYALNNAAMQIGFRGRAGTMEFIHRDLQHRDHEVQSVAENGRDRAEARITGEVMCGVVSKRRVGKQGRSIIMQIDLVTDQKRTPLRAGQKMRLLDDEAKLEFEILEISREPQGGLVVSLQLVVGMRSPDDWPDEGDEIEIGLCSIFSRKGIFAWDRLSKLQARPPLTTITSRTKNYVSIIKHLEG